MTSNAPNTLHVAIRAAQAAALIHRSNVGADLGIKTKSSITDLVTRVDGESERIIREIIGGAFPDHAVLGEEEGQSRAGASHRWIVDPLDGTLNYAHGFPFYCVSVALEVEGELQVGVVLDSARGELFTAWRGGGAWLNGAPIRVSEEDVLRSAMLATGFPYDPAGVLDNIEVFRRVTPKVRAVRRPGAAALDLSYVACGRLDGFWELKLNAWDVAAGVLLIREAGGRVTSPSGGPYSVEDPVLVSSNGRIHEALLEALALT
ncbi:inositol monophosphatase family protein [soil metagenome]|jgi:myo-inositol-1(or 4)-monophosphatase|nr:inositol monophosphatase [Deinococcota bacterium]